MCAPNFLYIVKKFKKNVDKKNLIVYIKYKHTF